MKIDEFSKISGVSVYTLRFYDKLNILKPISVNQDNRYRSYGPEQLSRVAEINSLKELGVPLKGMSAIFSASTDDSNMIRVIADRQISELQIKIKHIEDQIKHIQASLFLYNNGGFNMMNGITVKTTRAFLAATLRKKYDKNTKRYDEFSMDLWNSLENEIQKNGGSLSTPCLTLYYSGLYLEQNNKIVDQEIVEPLTHELVVDKNSEVLIREIPSEKVASIIHTEGFENIDVVGNKLIAWVKENGYVVSGPIREIYHIDQKNPDDVNTIELQLPLKNS
ncbi:MerR family transcriptional regulator [Liquorilactobacillus capillatus]|uniref:HTH merR-type domain-containing protein n=1 Tax=Liquorilactobacillus capillatus DSM 19910 TaxID=1423731 RepID=A0A0R1M7S7_9LACO|nr:MerR family transcriptional regulator [Liquorilactobacillus capillatus]KRL00930.1 hypothetical protein FC81_GL001765 [Liquorilactobacillus capillatus DSM 19910]